MKRRYLLVTAALMLILSGCSSIDGYLEAAIEKRSGMKTDTNYQTYQVYVDKGSLDQDGYYLEDVLEPEGDNADAPSDVAKVTFSKNGYLKIHYYKDAELTDEIVSASVLLAVDDCVYASISLDKSVSSTTYGFLGFRLSEIDEDGDRIELGMLQPDENGLIIQLPEQYIGKELAIDPLGAYETRQVTLRDSYIDNDEIEHDLSGMWIVNDKPISGHIAEINPVSSYIISYEFDSDEYFYLSSEPECFYNSNEDGVVIFNKRESTAETVDYSVKLHQYIAVDLTSAQNRFVNINNGMEKEVKAGNKLHISRLRYGDKVEIVTDVKWDELKTNRELVLQSSEELHQSGKTAYRYTLVVPQKGSEFVFDPSEYSYAHGTISFRCFGEEVSSVQYLAPESKITYEQKTAEDGYWLAEGNHVITVTTPEATRKQLESIHFTKKVGVKVRLAQPEYGGRIEYYANGSRIYGNVFRGDSGTEIMMKFRPWEGWINNYNNGEKYIVTSVATQSVTINGKSVAISAFTESTEHKPTLEVVLSKSVGEGMKFQFEASGLGAKDYKYEDGWFRSDYTVINKQTIGTERGIKLTMGNRAIQSGTAIKILVEMSGEDKSGNKTQKVNNRYYRLVDSLTDLQAPIEIYDSSSMGISSIWYKSIRITISMVDVKRLSLPAAPANGVITVRSYDSSKIMKNGDILEGSEKVTVTITANNGYYVNGKNVKNDVFQTTVKFEKCISDIQKMLKDHPIEKYIRVNLNAVDAYGSCVYKRDGKIVTGTIYVKLGDEITLEYKIINSDYIIEGASGILGTPIGKNEKEASKTLKIDQSYDGTTLSRNTFGINVKKGA